MKFLKIKIHAVIYLLLGYVTAALNVILNLLLVKGLSVENYGLISLGKTVFQTYEYSHLGIRFAFDRILPDIDDSLLRLHYFKVGFYYNLLTSLIFSLFWVVYYRLNICFYIWFIIAGYIYSSIQLIRIYYRSFDNKLFFVKVSTISFLLPIISQIIMYYIWGYWGVGFGLLLANLIVLYLLRRVFDLKSIFDFVNFNNFKNTGFKLINTGWILFITSMLSFFAVNGDRFFIERYWGLETVGCYSAVLLFPSLINIFSTSFVELIISKIIQKKSYKYVFINILLIIIVVAVCICSIYFVLPYILNNYLEKYAMLLTQIRYAIFLSLFVSVVPILEYYFHAIDLRKYILITQVISISVYFVLVFYVLYSYNNEIYALLNVKYVYYVLTIFILCFFIFKEKHKMKEYL